MTQEFVRNIVPMSAFISSDEPSDMQEAVDAAHKGPCIIKLAHLDSMTEKADALTRYIRFILKSLMKGSDSDPGGEQALHLASSGDAISTYSPKVMNATGALLSIHEQPAYHSEVPGMYSANSSFVTGMSRYQGNAALMGYGRILTEVFEIAPSQYGSLYSMIVSDTSELPTLVLRAIFGSNLANTLIKSLKMSHQENRSGWRTEGICSTVKQIYFPVDRDTATYEVLAILNSPGLRQAFSDYLYTLEEQAGPIHHDKTSGDEGGISIPTGSLRVGGTKPVNAGEVICRLSGNLRCLKSVPPVYNPVLNIEAALNGLSQHANIFRCIERRSVSLSDGDGKAMKRFFEPAPAGRYTAVHTKRAKLAVRSLLADALQPVFELANSAPHIPSETYQRMPECMAIWMNPGRRTGAMTQSELRHLAALAFSEVMSKITFWDGSHSMPLTDDMCIALTESLQSLLADY